MVTTDPIADMLTRLTEEEKKERNHIEQGR